MLKNMNFLFKLLVFSALVSSCSHLSNNLVSRDNFYISSGRHEDKKWEDQWKGKRISWFRELTLFSDIMLFPLEEQSPFFAWVDESTRETIKKCESAYLAIFYTFDSDIFSQVNFKEELLRDNQVSLFSVSRIKSYFKGHAAYDDNNFRVYRFTGICRKTADSLTLAIPGFNREKLL